MLNPVYQYWYYYELTLTQFINIEEFREIGFIRGFRIYLLRMPLSTRNSRIVSALFSGYSFILLNQKELIFSFRWKKSEICSWTLFTWICFQCTYTVVRFQIIKGLDLWRPCTKISGQLRQCKHNWNKHGIWTSFLSYRFEP